MCYSVHETPNTDIVGFIKSCDKLASSKHWYRRMRGQTSASIGFKRKSKLKKKEIFHTFVLKIKKYSFFSYCSILYIIGQNFVNSWSMDHQLSAKIFQVVCLRFEIQGHTECELILLLFVFVVRHRKCTQNWSMVHKFWRIPALGRTVKIIVNCSDFKILSKCFVCLSSINCLPHEMES